MNIKKKIPTQTICKFFQEISLKFNNLSMQQNVNMKKLYFYIKKFVKIYNLNILAEYVCSMKKGSNADGKACNIK